MARGGSRPGAGRKPGSLTKKTREVAERAIAEGLSPLEVMLSAMKRHVDANDWDKAASVAKDAAPYVHPKLQAIEHAGKDGGPIQQISMTEEEFEAIAKRVVDDV